MAVICHVEHSTHAFSYHSDTKMLVAEVSTLTNGRKKEVFGQVYDDACDEGFVLVSHHTGKEITFAVDSVDKDSEGDVAGWRLIPINRKTGHRDTSVQFTVLVIND